MSGWKIIRIGLAGFGLASQLPAATNHLSHVTDSVARRSLVAMRDLVSTTNFQLIGFQSVAETRSAQLGEPLIIRTVRLDRLRLFNATSNVDALLGPETTVLYPVEVAGESRCGIRLAEFPGGWRAVMYGMPNQSRQWFLARRSAALTAAVPEIAIFGVSVPALQVDLVGYRKGNQRFLASISNQPSLGLRTNEFLTATQVLVALVPFAQQYNEQPH